MEDVGPERVGRILRDDPADPSQRSHCRQIQETPTEADEGERSASQDDERNLAGNQSKFFFYFNTVVIPFRKSSG